MVRVFIAGLIAMVISVVIGPKFIEFLRRNEIGQQIREEGPAGHAVKQGTPVNIFYPDPTAEDKKTDAEKEKDKKEGKGATAGGAGGGAAAADITVPPIAKQTKEAYAKAAADLGIVPVVVKQFNDARPNTLFGTNPEPGTKVKKGTKQVKAEELAREIGGGVPSLILHSPKNLGILLANPEEP